MTCMQAHCMAASCCSPSLPHAPAPLLTRALGFQNADRDNLKAQMAMEVLAIIMGNPFFAELRTKQQLGYIVYGGVSNREDVRSLIFTAQSSVADAPYLTDRIFDFTNSFSLKDISDEQVCPPLCLCCRRILRRSPDLATFLSRELARIRSCAARAPFTRGRRGPSLLARRGGDMPCLYWSGGD